MFIKWAAVVIGGSPFLGICCILRAKYTPKPRGCVRIKPSKAQYKPLNLSYLSFNFDAPQTAVTEVPDQKKGVTGLNISYPELKAKPYCSYLPITPAFLVMVETESRSPIACLTESENRISEKTYSNSAVNVYGSLFLLDGESTSPIRFLLTDNVSNLFQGALYLDCRPNVDSLAPAIRYVQEDIIELVQTFSWKE